jgi:DNA-binding HxlR family transcriptional regulator
MLSVLDNQELEDESHCLIFFPLNVMSKKWNINIIVSLMRIDEREQRLIHLSYAELQELIPNISPKMLAGRLQELIDARIIQKINNPSTPKKVKYQLTEKGIEFLPIIREMRKWGEKFGGGHTYEKCMKNKCTHAFNFMEVKRHMLKLKTV